VRTLAFIDRDGLRLVNRKRHNSADGYPELTFLQRLPPGTVLDGEIVVLKNGQPDFGGLLARKLFTSPLKIQLRSRFEPVSYICVRSALRLASTYNVAALGSETIAACAPGA
jgi:ATP-dependent DNA ligase